MLIYKNKAHSYLRTWITGNAEEDKKDTVLCVVTGGVDSCTTAAICASLSKKLIVIFAGFKPEQENAFEQWLIAKHPENSYEIIKPKFPELDLPDANNIDSKESMLLAYTDIYAKRYNALTVGSITKSEHDLVKFFKRRVDTAHDCYPIIDLFRSEVLELAKHIGLPDEVVSAKSITEDSFGYSYDELEWLAREDYNLGIVSAIKDPTGSKYWALYNIRNKAMLGAVYKMNKMSGNKEIPKHKMCKIRTSLPGVVK